MNWTDKAPTEPGMYWYSSELAEREPQIVHIQGVSIRCTDRIGFPSGGLRLVELHMILEDQSTMPLSMVKGWWAGPLVPPKAGDKT